MYPPLCLAGLQHRLEACATFFSKYMWVRIAHQTFPMTQQNKFPPGWDEARVHRVLAHYEQQTEAEVVAEDEAAFENGMWASGSEALVRLCAIN